MALLIMAGLFSCKTPAERIALQFTKHSIDAKRKCIEMYPPKETITTTIQYLPGFPILTPGPVINCDSLKPNANGLKVFECPPSKTIHDTVIIDSTKTLYDTKQIDVLKADLDNYRANYEIYKQLDEQNQKRIEKLERNLVKWKALLGIFALVAGLLIFTILKG
jgi:hypothetical protein